MTTASTAGGLYADCVTPFDTEGRVDLGALRAVLEYVLSAGVDGVIVAGGTGEGDALSAAERREVLRTAVRQARGRAPVVSGPAAATPGEAIVGAVGVVCNLIPTEAVEARRGDAAKRRYVKSVADCVAASADRIALIKSTMNALGLPAGRPRGGVDAPPPEEYARLRELLAAGGRLAAGEADRPTAPRPVEPAAVVRLLRPGAVDEALSAEAVGGEPVAVCRPGDWEFQYNHHPAIVHHDGLYFAAWSSAPVNEDSPGQTVRFATSADGRAWSAPADVTPPPAGRMRWTAGGLWVRDGELLALAARCARARYVDGEAAPGVCWEHLVAEAFRWDGVGWEAAGVLADDFYPNEAPRPLPDGRWLLPGVNGRHDAVALIGGCRAIDDWHVSVLAARADGYKLAEPSWYLAADGSVRVLLRDDGGSRRLHLCESRDAGRSWSPPAPTDFTDAQAKFHALRLPSGAVAVVCNPAAGDLRRRFLAVALSGDGRTFDRLRTLRLDPDARPRMPGMHKAPGFQYPAATVAEGRMWVIYSVNKEDIEVLPVDLGALGQ